LQILHKSNIGIAVALQLAQRGGHSMNDILTLALIVVAVPIIALIIFLNFDKPKRRRRPVSNFR
jgi:hypothetical protein